MRWILAIGVLLASIVGACVGPFAGRGPVEPAAYDLHVDNGTTLAVSIVVDGRPAGVAAAGQGLTLASGTLPNGEYVVEATTPSGRVLSKGKIHPGDVTRTVEGDGVTGASGDGFRVDLSCGRLDVWVGVPMAGPAPDPGTPGDCDP